GLAGVRGGASLQIPFPGSRNGLQGNASRLPCSYALGGYKCPRPNFCHTIFMLVGVAAGGRRYSPFVWEARPWGEASGFRPLAVLRPASPRGRASPQGPLML